MKNPNMIQIEIFEYFFLYFYSLILMENPVVFEIGALDRQSSFLWSANVWRIEEFFGILIQMAATGCSIMPNIANSSKLLYPKFSQGTL